MGRSVLHDRVRALKKPRAGVKEAKDVQLFTSFGVVVVELLRELLGFLLRARG